MVLEPPPWPGARETNYTDLDVPLPEGMEVEELAVPLWRLRLPVGKLVKKGLAALAARRRVSQLIGERQVDVLLLYNVPQVALAECARGRCRVVFDVADDLLAMLAAESGRWAGLTVPLARACLRRLARASNWVTTSAQTLVPELPGRVRYLPNGVDWQAVAEADGLALRARWGQPLVGFVGAFEYAVDLALILEAAARLPQVGFLLVGSGRCLPWLESQVRARGLGNVHLPGPVPYPRNLDYVEALDIGLLPRVPGQVADHAAPLKLLEYLALGKPVIATPMKETRAIAGEFVWEARDGAEAAACIERILAAPEAAAARAAAGRERLRERLDWNRIASEFAAVVSSGSDQ